MSSGTYSSHAQAAAVALRKPEDLETYQGGTVVVREQVASMPNKAVCPCSHIEERRQVESGSGAHYRAQGVQGPAVISNG